MKLSNWNVYLISILVTVIIGLILHIYIYQVFSVHNNQFETTGQMGDTIGGFTTPIINLIAALVVFLSFYAQISANKQQFESYKKQEKDNTLNNNFDRLYRLYSEIREDYLGLEYIGEQDTYYAIRALNIFSRKVQRNIIYLQNGTYFMDRILNLHRSIEFLVKKIDQTELSLLDKSIIRTKILDTYNYQFNDAMFELLTILSKKYDNNKNHEILKKNLIKEWQDWVSSLQTEINKTINTWHEQEKR